MPRNHQNATYCSGGCLTDLEPLPTSEVIEDESGALLCEACWFALLADDDTDPDPTAVNGCGSACYRKGGHRHGREA
jgi:hypothetical protein